MIGLTYRVKVSGSSRAGFQEKETGRTQKQGNLIHFGKCCCWYPLGLCMEKPNKNMGFKEMLVLSLGVWSMGRDKYVEGVSAGEQAAWCRQQGRHANEQTASSVLLLTPLW